MGLELDLFEGEIDPNLICPVCKKVFVNPVSTSCQHIFCHNCIKSRLTSAGSKVCPECSSRLRKEPSEVSVELKLKLLELRIKCSNQCGTVCPLADLPDHVADVCPCAPVPCPNKDIGCTKTVKRKEVGLHEEECYFRYVNCEACDFHVQYCDLFTHQHKTRCLEKKLRQQVARASKSINIEVQRHHSNVKRQHMQIERYQRETLMKQLKGKPSIKKSSPRISVGSKGDLSDDVFSENNSFISGQTSSTEVGIPSNQTKAPHPSHSSQAVVTCKNCKKAFRETSNHAKACIYHVGTCYGCGRMDYQHGCRTSHHAPEVQRSSHVDNAKLKSK